MRQRSTSTSGQIDTNEEKIRELEASNNKLRSGIQEYIRKTNRR